MNCTRLTFRREGASRVRERSDQTRLREARGTGPNGERPSEGGPTGTTELVCGATDRPTIECRARLTPVTGTCLLRRFSGSTRLLSGRMRSKTWKSGVSR